MLTYRLTGTTEHSGSTATNQPILGPPGHRRPQQTATPPHLRAPWCAGGAALLTYNVVPAEAMAANVQPGQVTTVNSAPFTVALDGGSVAISDGQGNQANVIETDIDASNGVIHAIDAVLLPAQS